LVFKFFGADRDGLLNESEFKKMVHEIYPKDDENTLQKKFKGGMKAIGVKKGGADYQDLSKAVGQLKFREPHSCAAYQGLYFLKYHDQWPQEL
jgi:Ca2+-binding EF-hand superfamily protein